MKHVVCVPYEEVGLECAALCLAGAVLCGIASVNRMHLELTADIGL